MGISERQFFRLIRETCERGVEGSSGALLSEVYKKVGVYPTISCRFAGRCRTCYVEEFGNAIDPRTGEPFDNAEGLLAGQMNMGILTPSVGSAATGMLRRYLDFLTEEEINPDEDLPGERPATVH
jgi:hypothetical protein